MITRLKSNRIILKDGITDGYVYYDENGIISVTCEEKEYEKEIDCGDMYVSPGFIDIHVHGALDEDFCEADPDGIVNACNFHLRHGTTTILPTVTSVTFPLIDKSLCNLKSAVASGKIIPNVAGAHLEGPYFSPKMCGAQNPDNITLPKKTDYLPLIEKHGDIIKRWSFAPELSGSVEFSQELVQRGIMPSVGHSAAVYSDVKAVYDKGVRQITHLFCCTSTITKKNAYRSLGVIESAFLLDGITAELIADGCHLPPELINMTLKIMGDGNIVFITDAMQATGSESKTSSIGGVPCIIEDGVAKLTDRSSFAGSVATADRLVRVGYKDCKMPIYTAVKFASYNPARLLGLKKGSIENGYDADLLVFDDDINIKKVIVGGKEV